MTYKFKETSEEIVSPNKKKFKKKISPWMAGSPILTNGINIYHYLLLESITAPDGETLSLTFDTNEVQMEINWLEINFLDLM